MKWKFDQIYRLLNSKSALKALTKSKHGIERECLRINKQGELSKKSHPHKLGSALTSPYITTDFSESQLELVTPTFSTEEGAVKFLEDLHAFICQNGAKELLWPFSMPGKLPSEKHIPLAEYGKSRTGQRRTLYRLGLAHRYGRKMQTVSGTHYNFSFSPELWSILHKKFAAKSDLQNFISESYLNLTRNFLRFGWLNTYLFGAAPAIDKSYCRKHPRFLKKLNKNTCVGPDSTSFRTSTLGYYSKVQEQHSVSFNSLPEYISGMNYAISTPKRPYRKLPGINGNILQIENEHYSRIRPKRSQEGDETPLEAISKNGVEYVEVRAVDIHPYNSVGLSRNQLCFLHTFLLYSLLKPSPAISEKEEKEITSNQNTVALHGRRTDLKIQKSGRPTFMKNWASKMLEEMEPVAKLLDKAYKTKRYSESLEFQHQKVEDSNLTPSAEILTEMKERGESFADFGLRLAKMHCKDFCGSKLSESKRKHLEEVAAKSHLDQRNIEIIEDTFFEGYEDMEISTQMLLKEAKAQKIAFEVLDREDDFIMLSKGRKNEYVKQATQTSKDSIVSYFMMENKNVSKQILAQQGIKVPTGITFTDIETALNADAFFHELVVVKPTFANHGIGISFVNPSNKAKFKEAVNEAFRHGDSVIIEDFIPGNEYRFLVIDYKIISVVQRIPANVTGDGKHTVSELIDIKNYDARNYKFIEDYNIRKGKVEREHLQMQNLKLSSVPKAGRAIFLRTNSNVGTGGDPIEVLYRIDKKFKKIAEKAARLVKAKFCGVDLIIHGKDYAVIEINFNPALQMHQFPVKGTPINVTKPVLKTLGF